MREIARLCLLSAGKVHEVLQETAREQARAQSALPLNPETVSEAQAQREVETETVAEVERATEVEVEAPAAIASERNSEGSEQRDQVEEAESPDRGMDRLLARLGMLEDAEPLFGSQARVEWAGTMMALALWAACPFGELCQKAYGSLGAAFYGLGTVMRTLVTMALLRLHRPENLRDHDPVKLGRILGLDRAPEVKTLRGKVHRLCAREQAAELMAQWAQYQVEQSARAPGVVFIDGHVQVYHGKEKIGQVYSNQARRVVKGRTENWVHLPGGTPLLSLCSAFNESLSAVLPEAMERAKELCGGEALTTIFDRGGWSTRMFEKILTRGDHFSTYRKGKYEPWGAEAFELRETQIGKRTYERAPCMRKLELPVYEARATDAKGRKRYRRTSRKLQLQEVRLWRGDGGETSIVSSRQDLDAVEIATLQLSRWGAQENSFKYLLAEFDLDSLWVYGTQELPEEVDHPDRTHSGLEKELAQLQARRKTLLARIWRQLPKEVSEEKETGAIKLKVARWVEQSRAKEAQALQELEEQIQEVSNRLEETPGREQARLGGYRQLQSEAKLLLNLVKMVAYELESQLCELLTPAYVNAEKEKRTVIAAALRGSGSLRLAPGELIVQLDPQASPHRTRALNAVLGELNRRRARYPGSHRVIRFELTPCPDAPVRPPRSQKPSRPHPPLRPQIGATLQRG